jgi:hypothetical protein
MSEYRLLIIGTICGSIGALADTTIIVLMIRERPKTIGADILALRFERYAAQLVSAGDFDAALEQIIGMLTHMGRASLVRARVYPASRPELPAQLRGIGEYQLAEWLEQALRRRYIAPAILDRLKPGASEGVKSAR